MDHNEKHSTVSIVIPAYNSEKTIERTIQSVLKQTYENFNLIIVDDCSTDNTVQKAKKFDDSRISIVCNNENIGFESNWNKALSRATGKYIKLLPDDDVLDENALQLQINILEKYPDVVLVGSKRNIVNSDDKVLLTRGSALGNSSFCKYENALKFIVRYGTNPIGEPGSTLFRKETARKIGQFNGIYPHFIDLDFYVRLLKYGDYYFIDQVLSNFRVWERSYSVANQKDQYIESKNFFYNLYSKNISISKVDIIFGYFNIFKIQILKRIFYFMLNRLK